MLTTSTLLVAVAAAALVAESARAQRVAACTQQLLKQNCLGTASCCWHTGTMATDQETCLSCIQIAPAERTNLASLWTMWGYNVDGNLPDANVDDILCPNLGNIVNHIVSCDDDGHITDLLLGNDRLYGEMKHICLLEPSAPYLETLTPAGNYLYGPVPECVATFTRLKQFWIEHNFLRGALPNLKPLEVSLNTLSAVKTVDCRIVADENYLKEVFGPDNNCFECGGGFDTLPAQCSPGLNWANKCRFYKGVDQDCPSDNGDPGGVPMVTVGGECTESDKGKKGCACNTGNSCDNGLVCSKQGVCIVSNTDRCALQPATVGCPCNPQTGRCATDDLFCKDPEIICVKASGAANLAANAVLAVVLAALMLLF